MRGTRARGTGCCGPGRVEGRVEGRAWRWCVGSFLVGVGVISWRVVGGGMFNISETETLALNKLLWFYLRVRGKGGKERRE